MRFLKTAASLLLSLAAPLLVIMTAIRVLLTPIFYQVEYHMPYFPEDPFGFTLIERLEGARISIDYLVNDAGIDYFNAYKLTDGSQFYNERELSHMLDVKMLVQKMISAWIILGAIVLLTGLAAWKLKKLAGYWKALSRGGLWTLGLIAAILVFVALSFSALFTQFHMLFFSGDTWLFEYSDTLIRLFPMQFWQDAFIWVGALSILQAALFYFLGKRWMKQQAVAE